jgi:hypothetical protein
LAGVEKGMEDPIAEIAGILTKETAPVRRPQTSRNNVQARLKVLAEQASLAPGKRTN